MNPPVTRRHRSRVLRALGVAPWVRRQPASALSVAEPPATGAAAPACVVMLPDGCAARELDLLGRAFAAFGEPLARSPRIRVSGGRPATPVPEASAFLVFGQAQAHALGRELNAAAMNRAQIVLADEPAAVLASGAGKRGLWMALRQLRRALGTRG